MMCKTLKHIFNWKKKHKDNLSNVENENFLLFLENLILVWCQQHISKKLGQGQQKNWKSRETLK